MFTKIRFLICYIFIVFPSIAFAQLSSRSENVSSEGSLIVQDVVFWFKLGGIIIFLVSIASLISKKKKNQPIDWEAWGIIGGAILTVAMLWLTDTSVSLTGEEQDRINTQQESGF